MVRRMTWFINFLWLHLPNHLVAFELAFPFVTLTTIAKKSFPKDVFPSTLMQIKQNKCFIESKFHMSQFGSRRLILLGLPNAIYLQFIAFKISFKEKIVDLLFDHAINITIV